MLLLVAVVYFYCYVAFHYANTHNLFTRSLADGHLGYFQSFGAIMNKLV